MPSLCLPSLLQKTLLGTLFPSRPFPPCPSSADVPLSSPLHLTIFYLLFSIKSISISYLSSFNSPSIFTGSLLLSHYNRTDQFHNLYNSDCSIVIDIDTSTTSCLLTLQALELHSCVVLQHWKDSPHDSTHCFEAR